LYRFIELPDLPVALSNYLSKANGSIFNMIPWFGYVAFGAFISTLFYRYLERPRFKIAIISSFFTIGLLLITHSSWLLMKLYYITDFELFKDFDVSDYTGFAFVRSPMKRIIGQLERAYENNNPIDYVDTTSIIQYVSKLLSEAAKGNWIDMHMRPQYDFLKNYNCKYYLDLDSETSLPTNHVFIDKVVSDFRSRKLWVDDGDHSKGKRNRSQAKNRFIKIVKNQILDEASLKIIYDTYKEDYELYESI
jgi:hypothetical protein